MQSLTVFASFQSDHIARSDSSQLNKTVELSRVGRCDQAFRSAAEDGNGEHPPTFGNTIESYYYISIPTSVIPGRINCIKTVGF
jgi:hypothetical protein